MRRSARPLSALGVIALLSTATPALAGTVTVFSRSETKTKSEAGQVSESFFHPDEQARASAYEFLGGVGVASSAQSVSRAYPPFFSPSDNIPQASATAAFADVFFARSGVAGLLGNGTYLLTFAIKASGGVATSQTPAPNPDFPGGVPMSAQAAYNFNYRIGNNIYREGGLNQVNFEGSVTTVESGIGGGGTFYEQLVVNTGNFTTLALNASSFAAASSYGLGASSATATFDHTLRWGGVTRIQYDAGGGNFVDAPEGFSIDLISDNTGFNYWNAAGPNPFLPTGGVPEPASWAMLLMGFGLSGAMLRRRAALAA